MSAVAYEATQALSADQMLADARAAWAAKRKAEATLSRLRQYRTQTPGMRYDADRALAQLSSANATIDRVLGGAA